MIATSVEIAVCSAVLIGLSVRIALIRSACSCTIGSTSAPSYFHTSFPDRSVMIASRFAAPFVPTIGAGLTLVGLTILYGRIEW